MDRRVFVVGSVTCFFLPGAVASQPADRPWRIGYLSEGFVEKTRIAAFRQGLRELGYVEGQNLIIEERYAGQRAEELPALAAELVRLPIDVAVVRGTPAITAAQRAHPTLPIVMTVHADPVGTGLVPSVARPGGRITGLMDGHADLAPKRLELLQEAVPSVSRIGALYNPATAHAVRQLQHIQAAAPRRGLTIVPIEVKGPREIDAALAATRTKHADAIFIIPDPSWSGGHSRRLADFAVKQRLPMIGTTGTTAQEGMLMAYGANFDRLWHRAATYVDKILKGVSPGELPIEHPTKFDLVINLKTARALGVTIPPSLLLRADHVIE